jgi:hypothetical protein
MRDVHVTLAQLRGETQVAAVAGASVAELLLGGLAS